MGSKGIETKEKIIFQALQLFSVKGYYHTSIGDILEAAGLTKGGLYGHFQSKEEIWEDAYDKAVEIWKQLVFETVRSVRDPLERIKKALDNDLRYYLGGDVFKGGCFFLNMLVELSGQSDSMSSRVLDGMMGFSKVIADWLAEADEKGFLKAGLNISEISKFIIVTISGCAALYASTRDPSIWKLTLSQLNHYIDGLRTQNKEAYHDIKP